MALLRLSKCMADQGLCSRREADAWIAKGWVSVDGQPVSLLGSKIYPYQKITIARPGMLEQAQRVTILLHKPVGYVSAQAELSYQPAVVLIRPENYWQQQNLPVLHQRQDFAPAGRLDIDSTGLLVLTQDGRIARKLIGEHSLLEKEYLVRVRYREKNTNFPASSLRLLNHGMYLDGRALRPAQVDWQNADQLRFILREGKKRQIRRMCAMVGLEVLALKRVRIGRVSLGNLPVGKWRYLRKDEHF